MNEKKGAGKRSFKGMTEAKEFGDHLEKLNDRLNKRMSGGKIRSSLNKKKSKSHIPGFGYWFTKK